MPEFIERLKAERQGYIERWGESTFFQCPWWRPRRMRKQAAYLEQQEIDDPFHKKIHMFLYWQ